MEESDVTLCQADYDHDCHKLGECVSEASSATTKTKGSKTKVVVYDAEARYEKHLIKHVCNKYKNFSYSNNIKMSNILYYGKHFMTNEDIDLAMKIKGYVNRVPGAEIFREKYTQARVFNQLRESFPNEFEFHPITYGLPRDMEAMEESIKKHPKKLMIAKPSEGGGGGGIFLFKKKRDLSGITWTQEGVVQRYVPNPMLIKNKKWDMRVYVLIHGVNPMKAYISTEYGLARFGTSDYDTSDTNNIMSHLTNYSLNKNSKDYVKGGASDSIDEELNTKIIMKDVWKLVQDSYPDADVDNLKQKMKDGVANVLSAMRSTIELKFNDIMVSSGYKDYAKHNQKFFQILGFDIMFDTDYKAWLFEVNAFPSMDILHHVDNADGSTTKDTSEVDELAKGTVFTEAVNIVLNKKESGVFELVYDSSEQSGDCQLYEDVFAIYKALSGVKLSTTITSSKFTKLASYLPKSMGVTKIDLELLYKKSLFDDNSTMGLITFFTALSKLSEKQNMDITTLVDSVKI